jgi:hypothetical protein
MRRTLLPLFALSALSLAACGDAYDSFDAWDEPYEPVDAYDLSVDADDPFRPYDDAEPYDPTVGTVTDLGARWYAVYDRLGLAAADVDGSYGYAYVVDPVTPDDVETMVRGTYRVQATPSDRGMWLERDGNRVFALLHDEPRDAWIDIDPGQVIEVRDATVRTPEDLKRVEGRALDADSKRIARNQEMFLVIDEEDVRIVASY